MKQFKVWRILKTLEYQIVEASNSDEAYDKALERDEPWTPLDEISAPDPEIRVEEE